MRDSYGSRGGGGGGGNGPVAKIYIGNLSSRVSEREIYDTFGKYGSIRKVELKNHYGFVEYQSSGEAHDAVREMNGYSFDHQKVNVELAKGSKPRHNPPSRSDYKLTVDNLSSDVSWQMLKDHMRTAGEVIYADIMKDRSGRSKGYGVVEFKTLDDMERAIKDLDGTKLGGTYIRVSEDRGRDRDRDRDYDRRGRGSSRDRFRPYDRDRRRSPRGRDSYERRRSPYGSDRRERRDDRSRDYSPRGGGRDRSPRRDSRRDYSPRDNSRSRNDRKRSPRRSPSPRGDNRSPRDSGADNNHRSPSPRHSPRHASPSPVRRSPEGDRSPRSPHNDNGNDDRGSVSPRRSPYQENEARSPSQDRD